MTGIDIDWNRDVGADLCNRLTRERSNGEEEIKHVCKQLQA
jgi:hypothetical protein